LEKTHNTTIWKTIRRHNTHQRAIPPLNSKTQFHDKCDELHNALFPPRVTDPTLSLLGNISYKEDRSDEIGLITRREISWTIRHLNLNSAPGNDGLGYQVIAQFDEASPTSLPLLFNAMLKYSVHPVSWKHAICIVIPKQGKPDYKSPTAYRPISLLSCFGKLMEALLSKRIASAALRTGAISTIQMGGTAHNSSTDGLIVTLSNISSAIAQYTKGRSKNCRIPVRTSLLTHNISGVFNNTDTNIIVKIMEKRQMPLNLINWVKAFTSNRTLSFSCDGQIETPKHFKCDLPQGSPVLPILFLIVANIVIEPPTPNPDPTVSYIYDIGMTESGTNDIETMEKLRIRTKEQLNRAEGVGLKFAPDKSELIHCAAKGTHHDLSQEDIFPTLIIDNTNGFEIRPSKQIKKLGVIIDSTLSFKQHAIQAASAMKCRLGALCFLRNTKTGISAYIANHLALTAILPKLYWASPVWWNNPKQSSTLLQKHIIV
jgi:hypothetical protein